MILITNSHPVIKTHILKISLLSNIHLFVKEFCVTWDFKGHKLLNPLDCTYIFLLHLSTILDTHIPQLKSHDIPPSNFSSPHI